MSDELQTVDEIEDNSPPWFYRIEDVADPWRDWFRQLDVPCGVYSPLYSDLEWHIEGLLWLADQRRLSIKPTTKHFTAMWATYREHHEKLEDSWKYRRLRYIAWRASALKVFHDRGRHQDAADVAMIRGKLEDILTHHAPLKWDGSYGSYNFWVPQLVKNEDGSEQPSPFEVYASMTLMLIRATWCATTQRDCKETGYQRFQKWLADPYEQFKKSMRR